MSPWNLDSAVVPVTGAASGIGLAICKGLRAAGATPLLLDVNADALKVAAHEVYAELDASSAARFTYRLDVSDPGEVEQCFAQIRSDHGQVTHAVSNAGISGPGSILDVSDEQWRRTLDVNLNGTMYFCREAARQLAERKKGSIVLTASIAGVGAKAGSLAYSSSKAAVINFTRGLALDLGDHNVRANAVAPGIIDTPMQKKRTPEQLAAVVSRAGLKRLGTAEEVANVALFLLSDLSSYVSGHTIVVDGGLTANYS